MREQPQLTGRALLTGCGIGVMLAAANVYTGLKISIIDGGSITAALLGFTIFATFTRLSRNRPYTAIENNITQTTAASAAIMGFSAGLGGPVPAIEMSGRHFPIWGLIVWGASLALIGVIAAAVLRRKLIVEDALPFPTGNATGNLIETMFEARNTALRRARLLIGGALFAAAVTWFRDGHPKIIPEMSLFGLAVGGLSLNGVSFGMSWSPLVMSTGIMMGLRAALSMFLGAAIGWGALSPWLVNHHVVAHLDFSTCLTWLVWPGLGMLLAGGLLPLLLDWRPIARAIRDLAGLVVARRREPSADRSGWVGAALMLAGAVGVVVVARAIFGFHVLTTSLVLVFALVMAVVSSRATGETDLAPVGAVGTVTQILFARCGTIGSMLTASVTFGTSTQAAQTLWALKAGQKLKAAPRPQLIAQLTGALLGALVVAPVYVILVKAYGVGTESLPAPSAVSVKATAEAMRGGLSTLPPYATLAGGVGLLVGSLLTLIARTRWARFCPSPAAMGIAMIIPPSLSVAGLAGVLLGQLARRLRPSLDEDAVTSIAAGGLAGESVMGVVIAVLVLLGVV